MSQSVDRALRLLDAVSGHPRSLEDLAAQLSVHKSTVLRLLQTLEAAGYVRHDERHRYSLGLRAFELSTAALDQRGVVEIAREPLAELNVSTGHTLHLAVRDGSEAVYVDKFEARAGLRMYSRIGLRAPLHATAVGKVLLAHSADRAKWLKEARLSRFTDRTITGPSALEVELDFVIRAGWASDRGEHEVHMNCVAVPIVNGLGATIAAASLSVPEVVLPWSEVKALIPSLQATGREISVRLGHRPDE